MNHEKFIGMALHQASISITVSDAAGKVLMECIIETKAATVLEFIQGLRGSLWVTLEEGTSAAWLYDLLKPHVAKVVVCAVFRGVELLLRERAHQQAQSL